MLRQGTVNKADQYEDEETEWNGGKPEVARPAILGVGDPAHGDASSTTWCIG